MPQIHTRRGCGPTSLVFDPTPILKSLACPWDNRKYLCPVEHHCLKVYLHTCYGYLLTGKHGDLLLELVFVCSFFFQKYQFYSCIAITIIVIRT